MARWLRDAETGELFREDELDPSSYEPVTDWQSVAPEQSTEREYEFPSWLTSGLGSTIPARSLASLGRAGAGLEQILGDAASNIPGLEDNWLQRNSAAGRKMVEDLVSQSREENQVEPGSFQDIAGAVTGEVLPSLATLGGGMALGAGKGALAVAPALMPSATKYSDLKDRGASGLEAAQGAAESLVLNSLLNKADVAAALRPIGAAKRIGQTAAVGAGTNLLGAYGDALIDKQVGAPLSRDEVINNLITSTAAGAATGAGFGALPTRMRQTGELDVPEGQGIADLLGRMEQEASPPPEPPSGPDAQSGIQAFNEYAADPFQNFLAMPKPYAGPDKLLPGWEAPIVDRRSPSVDPLIEVIEGSRVRDYEGRQRELENIFLPEDTELAKFRETKPLNTKEVIDIQRTTSPRTEGQILQSVGDGFNLSAEEQQIASYVRAASGPRVATSRITDNQAALAELLSKRDESRSIGKKASSTSDDGLIIRATKQQEEFPDSIVKNLAEASSKPPTNVVLPPGAEVSTSPLPMSLVPERLKPQPPPAPTIEPVEVYQSRTSPEVVRPDPLMEQVSRLTQGTSGLISDADIPIIGQPPAANNFEGIIRPDELGTAPGQVWLDPTSQVGIDRAAASRLANAQRQPEVEILQGETYAPKRIDPSLANVKVKRKTQGAQMSLFDNASQASDSLKLYVDGVEGREIPYTDVPTGNQAFQYAIGRVTADGSEAVFRRPVNQRGSYGGWRWESDTNKLLAKPVVEEQVAAVKPQGTQPNDLPNALGKRAASRRKKPVTSSEAGYIKLNEAPVIGDVIDLANWARKRWAKSGQGASNLSQYKDWSDTNKRYRSGAYGRVWEWMSTTMQKEPSSAKFIEGQWRIPQDTHAVVWDADETLRPYHNPDLSPKERQGVNNYLQAARILGSRDKGYTVSAETAGRAGLNQNQIDAALAVKRWSNFFADLFENESLAQAEHDAAMLKLKLPDGPDKAAKIAKVDETLLTTQETIAQTFKRWRDTNYVPFDRFGEHYINVRSPDGKLLARQQFESVKDPAYKKAIAHYEQLAQQPGEFAGAKIEYGRQPPVDKLQFKGVNKDILDMLGEDATSQPIEGFSRHFKTPRMIDGQVALVPGQSTDVGRSIADYTVGASRLLAFRRANRVADMELVTSLSGEDKVNLRAKLVDFQNSLNNVRGDGFRFLNDYFNFAYIGGNARTPTADILGAIQMQPLVLSKYLRGADPERVGIKTIGNLVNYYFGKKIDPSLAAAITEAQRKGIVPTDTFKDYIRAARGPSDTMKAMSAVKDAYFSLKGLSERFVDVGSFMSGWEAWNKLPKETRASIPQQQFAENMVREMRAVPSQYELPPNALFKTETGRLITKFRLYQAKITKALTETSMPGAIRYALGTFLTTGIAGLPLVGKEIFAAARASGVEPEDKLREAGLGSEVMYGPLSKLAGVDFSVSAGYGEVIPLQSANAGQKLMLGIAGAPWEALQRANQYRERGQYKKAIAALPMSNLLSNYLNQSDWADRGVVTMGGKAVIPRDEVQGVDRFKKLLGYQPLAVKEAMVLENRKKQADARATDNKHLNQRIGEAEGLGDYETADALRQVAENEGIKLNKNSIKNYRRMIQGEDKPHPKSARALIKELEAVYGGN